MTEPRVLAATGVLEIVELRRLEAEQPDLASAVYVQIELLQIQTRVLSRVPLPSIEFGTDYLKAVLASGLNLQFEHLPIE